MSEMMDRHRSAPGSRAWLALCLCLGACLLPLRLLAYAPAPLRAHGWTECGAPLPNVLPMYVVTKGMLDRTDGFTRTAAEAKAVLQARAPGQRVIFTDVVHAIDDHVSNYAWYDAADIATVDSYISQFLAAYRAVDGPLDTIVTDFEGGFSNWNLGSGAANYPKYQSIAADARYAADIEPRLDAYGFVSDANGELYYVCYWGQGGGEYAADYLRWNAVSAERLNQYLNTALWIPAQAYYPQVQYYNYGGYHYNTSYGFCDFNAHLNFLFGGGADAHAGTGSSPPLYAYVGAISSFSRYGANDPPVPYPATPFNGMRFSANQLRTTRLTDPSDPIRPWVAYRAFTGGACTLGNTDYYQELMLHLALGGADALLYWGPYSSTASDRDSVLLQEVLAEFNAVAGYANRSWISGMTTPNNITNWAYPFYLSGMVAGGRTVWRVTPDLACSGATMQDFKVSDTPPTFAIGSYLITFPSGSAMYTPAKAVAPNGYWVTAPLGATPTISAYTQVAAPTMSPGSGTYGSQQTVTLSCSTVGATIRYTIDGTTPTATSPAYAAPLAVSATTVLKAKAFKTGMSGSGEATANYLITGTAPTNFFTALYTGTRNDYSGNVGFEFTPAQEITVTALGRSISTAMAQGHTVRIWRVSDQAVVASATVTPLSAVTQGYAYEMLPASVTLTSGTAYRITSREYLGGDAWRNYSAGAISSHLATATISRACSAAADSYPSSNAGATDNGYGVPTFLTGAWSKIATPICSPDGGTSSAPVSVAISCATSGALMRYTTDGSEPTMASPAYTAALSVSGSVQVKAKAFKCGMADSDTATAAFEAQDSLTNYLYAPFNKAPMNEANAYTGNVGYEFTAQNAITIYALGRAVIGAMNNAHTVTLWRVSDQAPLASVSVSSASLTDTLGYKYVKLGTPVTLTKGTVYRLTSSETNGGDKYIDYWTQAGGSFYLNSHSPIASISGAVRSASGYPSTLYAYPNRCYGTATFFYGQANALPTVQLTAPAEGESCTQPCDITLTATAADDTSVTRVDFYQGAFMLGSDTVAPYGITWNNAPAGTWTLTARAYDASGYTTSRPITVTVRENGLVGHWKFDEGQGTTAADSSGAGNTGTLQNSPAWEAGRHAGALHFNYANQRYVRVPDSTSLHIDRTLTVACWVKSDAANWNSDAYGAFIGKHTGTSAAAIRGFTLWPVANYTAVDFFVSVNSTSYCAAWSPPDITGWHHYAGTFDGTALKFYVDGVLRATTNVASGDLNGAIDVAATKSLTIGKDAERGSYLNGLIDDARLYNRALDGAEINALYRDGDLVGCWHFDDGPGTTATDSSAYGNTGTLCNGPLWEAGKLGKALHFDGSTNYVQVPNAPSLSGISTGVTVACWAKSDTATWNAWGCLVSKRYAFILYPCQGSKSIQFLVSVDGALRGYPYTPTFDLTEWHHYAGTYDGTTVKLYIDGVLVGTPVTYAGTIAADAGNLEIGRDDGENTRIFDGAIDEVYVFNRALSGAEIAALYHSQ